jgi:tetratricopeptide (TPR) repeat protein
MALMFQGNFSNAIPHLARASELMPKGYDSQYNAVDINYHLGSAYYRVGQYQKCANALQNVLRFSTNHAEGNFMLAMAMAYQGETSATAPYYQRAISSKPPLARLPDYYDLISLNYLQKGNAEEALKASELSLKLAQEAGRNDQAAKLQQRIQQCLALAKKNSAP